MKQEKNKIIFIVGPTATGKTDVAAHLAEKINGEIVSCDSMQIYKKMDILTSKPSLELRKRIRHHLVGMVYPEEEYDVWRYRKEANKKIKGIIKKGKIPLLVGGTGLYMTILVDGIFKMKKPDERIRMRLYKDAAQKGSLVLHNRLKKIDPQAAAKIHPNDTRRIVRALEVFQSSGKPISELQKKRRGLFADNDVKIFCLNLPRQELYYRIGQRIEKMFCDGLIKEVKRLLGLKLSKTASYAIGIREVKGYLSGEYDLEQAKNIMKQNTRAYAKRQLTWFRKDKRIKWMAINKKERSREIAKRIFKLLGEEEILKINKRRPM